MGLDLIDAGQRLALHIQAVDLGRQRERLFVALRHQQPVGDVRVVQPARRVDSRRDAEPERRGVHVARLETGRLDQRSHAWTRKGVHDVQPGQHQASVFAQERHDVGHRGHRHQVQQRLHGGAALRQDGVGQRLDELEGDARAAQVIARVTAVRSPRIDQGVGIRQLGRALVVVGDDQVDAQLAGQVGRGVGGGATVGGDDDVGASGG